MNFNKHLELRGKHAPLGASRYHWINDTDDQIVKRICAQYASEVGTLIHDYACERVSFRLKMNRNEKKDVILELLRHGIPRVVIDELDMNTIYDNLVNYVNDCIGYRMSPEVKLVYSEICFGTCDAIAFYEKEKFLRIHDLKTGTMPGHMEQLLIYAALFCLEYRVKPIDIQCELRIYQNGEIVTLEPTANDILDIIGIIKEKNKAGERFLFAYDAGEEE